MADAGEVEPRLAVAARRLGGLRDMPIVLVVLLVIALVVHAASYFLSATRTIVFPFGLDYGEGSVWEQARRMFGPEMSSDLTHPPFIAFNYTPLYHVLVRASASAGFDPLYAGRSISLAAALAICGLVGGIAFRAVRERGSRPAAMMAAAVAGLVPLTYQPVQEWAMQMRVDMLAAALGTAGIYLAIGARGRIASLSGAVLLFVAALYTKQTELTAPAAALIVSAVTDFRATLKASAFGLIVGGAIFLELQLQTDGGFWRHVFSYNLDRFAWHHVAGQMLERLPDGFGLLSAAAAFWLLWRREITRVVHWDFGSLRNRLRDSVEERTLAVSSLWFVFATGLLVTAGKHGAASNYFIEWLCVTAIPIGTAIGMLWSSVGGSVRGTTLGASPGRARGAALLLPLALIVQAVRLPAFRFDAVDDPTAIASRVRIVALIRDSEKPVFSEDLTLLLRAGKPASIEPSTITELAAVGGWNPQPFLNQVRNREFAFFVTETRDARLTPEMFQAVLDSYPVVEKVGPYLVRRPASPS